MFYSFTKSAIELVFHADFIYTLIKYRSEKQTLQNYNILQQCLFKVSFKSISKFEKFTKTKKKY